MKNVPSGYTICPAEAWHLPFLNSIEMAAATIFPPAFLPPHVLLDKVPLPTLKKAMEHSLLWVALAEEEDPVGYALMRLYDNSALLAQMDVLPGHGRKGLGKALVERVIEEAERKGATNLYLTTFANIRWNAPFYAKCGFVEVPAGDQPEFIKTILHEERNHGLENRIAMRYNRSGMLE